MISVRISAILALAILPLGLWAFMRARGHDEVVHEVRVVHEAESSRDSRRERRSDDRMFHREFDVAPGGMLRVDLPDGDIQVAIGSSSKVEIEVLVRGRDADWAAEVFERMDFGASLEGNTVVVKARSPRIEGSEWRSNRGVGVTAKITVPAEFNAEIETSDGDIQLGALTGQISLRSSDGDISVGEISGAELTVHTSDGDIHAEALRTARTRLRTSDGDIFVQLANGDIEANTSDGDITMHIRDIQGVRLTTHDGDITLYAPESLGADVSLEGGDLSVPRGFSLQGQISERRVTGSLNGGGPRIEARTSDGEVSLRASGS